MSQKYIQSLTIPNDSQTLTRSQLRREVSKQGSVAGATGTAAKALSLDPDQQLLRGQYRGLYADKLAAELEELFSAPDIEEVAFHADPGPGPEDGYYVLENVDLERIDPREDRLAEFDGILTWKGGQGSMFRAIKTQVGDVDQPFGNEQTALVGVPAAATKVRWFDEQGVPTEPVTISATVTGEHGDVDLLDANSTSFAHPTLIYELPYSREWETDVVVWDSRGAGSKLDADGIVQWQRVFRPDHEFSGSAVFDTRFLRLTVDEAAQSMSAERWDSSTSTWSAVALRASDWVPYDLDIMRIGPARATAQLVFENSSDGLLYHLDVAMKRGYETAHFGRPKSESGPIPSGLQDLLAPIADGQDYSAGETQTVLSREEVRK